MNTEQLLRDYISTHKMVLLTDLKTEINTSSHMTIFRHLKKLHYLSSISHRGKYYTLSNIPEYNDYGIWIFSGVHFSKFGTVRKTLLEVINHSLAGFRSKELHDIIGVEIKKPLLGLLADKQIVRKKIAGSYIYFSIDGDTRKKQELARNNSLSNYALNLSAINEDVLAHELKAAIILFFSILDEKQRRLYAGLESIKIGHGGDAVIASLLGIDPHTVAKGRQEFMNHEIIQGRVRKKGAGRKSQEKKLPK
jgi:hypothetical protein